MKKTNIFLSILVGTFSIVPFIITSNYVEKERSVKAVEGIQDGFKYRIENNEAIITGWDINTPYPGYLNIPSEITNGGNNYKVTIIDKNAFKATEYEALYIEGKGIFYGELTIPKTIKEIRNYAFAYSCFDNDVIEIGDNIEKLGSSVFNSFCYYKIVSPSFYKKPIKSTWTPKTKIIFSKRINYIPSYFFQASNFKSIIIPKNVSEIQSRSFAIAKCDELIIEGQIEKIGIEPFDQFYIRNNPIIWLGKKIKEVPSLIAKWSYVYIALNDDIESFSSDAFKESWAKTPIYIPPKVSNLTSSMFDEARANSFVYDENKITDTSWMPFVPAKKVNLTNGKVQAFKTSDLEVASIQSISITGAKEIYDTTIDLSFNANFSNNNACYEIIEFNWERYDGNSWKTISNEHSISIPVDSSWNDNKIRLSATYNGKKVMSNEINVKVPVNAPASLTQASIVGVQDLYNYNEIINLALNLKFSNDNYDKNKVKYSWEKLDKKDSIYKKISSNESLSIISDKTLYDSKIRVVVEYENNKITTDSVDIRIKNKLLSIDIEGLSSQYDIGTNINVTGRVEFVDENTRIDKYKWEVFVGDEWISAELDSNRNFVYKITEESQPKKIRLSVQFEGETYSSEEKIISYSDNPINITDVKITGLKDYYSVGDGLNLTASVKLSNGVSDTNEVGYKWEIIKKTRTIETFNSKKLTIDFLDESYIGCTIKFIPSFNGVEDNSKTKTIFDSFNFGLTNKNDDKNTENNNLFLWIIIGFSVFVIIIIITSIFLFIRTRKNKRKIKTIPKQNVKINPRQNRLSNPSVRENYNYDSNQFTGYRNNSNQRFENNTGNNQFNNQRYTNQKYNQNKKF